MLRKFVGVLLASLSIFGCQAEYPVDHAAAPMVVQKISQQLHRPALEVAQYFREMTFNSAELHDFAATLLAAGNGLTLDKANAYSVAAAGQVGVYVPIRGGTSHSYFGLWFEPSSLKIVGSSIGLFVFDENRNINAKIDINGKPKLDAVIAPDGSILSGVRYDESGRAQTLSPSQGITQPDAVLAFLGCLNSCLSGLGVPSWLISALGVACGVICAGTAGVGCIPCLYAAAGGLGAELGWCIGMCT